MDLHESLRSLELRCEDSAKHALTRRRASNDETLGSATAAAPLRAHLNEHVHLWDLSGATLPRESSRLVLSRAGHRELKFGSGIESNNTGMLFYWYNCGSVHDVAFRPEPAIFSAFQVPELQSKTRSSILRSCVGWYNTIGEKRTGKGRYADEESAPKDVGQRELPSPFHEHRPACEGISPIGGHPKQGTKRKGQHWLSALKRQERTEERRAADNHHVQQHGRKNAEAVEQRVANLSLVQPADDEVNPYHVQARECQQSEEHRQECPLHPSAPHPSESCLGLVLGATRCGLYIA